MTITTQTRKMIRSTLLTGLAAIALMTTTSASATNYCEDAKYKQVYAYSNWTKDTHIHLDVACPADYRAISCEFDVTGKDDHDSNKFFVAINDAAPYQFDSNHNGHDLHGDYGCHFRANNFASYFPGYDDHNSPAQWRFKGFATCVPEKCVHVDDTHDYDDDHFNSTWYPDWDQFHN